MANAAPTRTRLGDLHQSWDCKFDELLGAFDDNPTSVATAMYHTVGGLDDAYRFERNQGVIYFVYNGAAVWQSESPSRL